MNKNKISFMLLPIQMFLITSCGAVENKTGDSTMNQEKGSGKTHYHIIGEREAIEAFGKELSKNDPIDELINQGASHYEQREYDLAITELKNALEKASGSNKWIAKGILGRAYEAKGEYALALQEINWQIAQSPRQEVIDKLTARKQKLEELLKKHPPQDK